MPSRESHGICSYYPFPPEATTKLHSVPTDLPMLNNSHKYQLHFSRWLPFASLLPCSLVLLSYHSHFYTLYAHQYRLIIISFYRRRLNQMGECKQQIQLYCLLYIPTELPSPALCFVCGF